MEDDQRGRKLSGIERRKSRGTIRPDRLRDSFKKECKTSKVCAQKGVRRIKDNVKSEDLPTRSEKLNKYYDTNLDPGDFQIMVSHTSATMGGGRKELGCKKKQNERLRVETGTVGFLKKIVREINNQIPQVNMDRAGNKFRNLGGARKTEQNL